MEQELDSTLAQVGPRLRSLRTSSNLTLHELSEQTGISLSTLSRLESGQRRPTLEQLLPLARAHRVPLDDLVGAPATGDPRIHIKPITGHGMTILPIIYSINFRKSGVVNGNLSAIIAVQFG